MRLLLGCIGEGGKNKLAGGNCGLLDLLLERHCFWFATVTVGVVVGAAR